MLALAKLEEEPQNTHPTMNGSISSISTTVENGNQQKLTKLEQEAIVCINIIPFQLRVIGEFCVL